MCKKRNKPRSRPAKPLCYKPDPQDKRQLILSNGTRLRQACDGVGLYLSQRGGVYALTRLGLRNRRVGFWKKNNYCKRIMHGCGRSQGQSYPYVGYRGRTYRVHRLMACAWLGGIPDGMVPDHINGDIDNFRCENLRVVPREENDRCGGILRRLRNASIKYNLPELNPRNMSRENLLERFEHYKDIPGRLIAQSIRMEAEFLLSQK